MSITVDQIIPLVSREVHPECEMYAYALSQIKDKDMTLSYYLHGGEMLARGLLNVLSELGMLPQEKTILDFACGYGRVTRWFPLLFKETTCSDLSPEMMEFNARAFGVRTLLSTLHPEDFASPAFDVVFVFSLFTHLNKDVWPQWYRVLAGKVAPGGLFVFSTHSYELMEQLSPGRLRRNRDRGDDFVFWEANETGGRLNPRVYGGNVVTPAFVMEVNRRQAGLEFYKHFTMGQFDQYHDIYVFRNPPLP